MRLAAQLYTKCDAKLQAKLYNPDTRTLNGRMSTPRLLAYLLHIVEDPDDESKGQSLTDWLERAPAANASQLVTEVERLYREMEKLTRLGFLEKGTRTTNTLLNAVLTRMTRRVATDPRWMEDLSAPMVWCRKQFPGDADRLLDEVRRCARIIQKRLSRRQKDGGRDRPGDRHNRPDSENRRHGDRHNRPDPENRAYAADVFNNICFHYRENNKCPGAPKGEPCQFQHTGRTGKQCSDAEYLKTGVCSQFKKCLNMHPKLPSHPNPRDLRLDEMNQSTELIKRAVSAATGQAFAMAPDGFEFSDELEPVDFDLITTGRRPMIPDDQLEFEPVATGREREIPDDLQILNWANETLIPLRPVADAPMQMAELGAEEPGGITQVTTPGSPREEADVDDKSSTEDTGCDSFEDLEASAEEIEESSRRALAGSIQDQLQLATRLSQMPMDLMSSAILPEGPRELTGATLLPMN
jgi:hypothetical protein